jgi:hypothetical protein
MNEKPNPHRGGSLDNFLKAEGIYEEVMASPKVKGVIRDQGDSIQAGQREAFTAGWNASRSHPGGNVQNRQLKHGDTGTGQAFERWINGYRCDGKDQVCGFLGKRS